MLYLLLALVLIGVITQLALIYSKLTIETLEEGVIFFV